MDQRRKFALIRTLALRAKRICSPEHLEDELNHLRLIFCRNGYPHPIVERTIDSVINPEPPVITVKRKPVFLRLPWLGQASTMFRKRIHRVTRDALPWCDTVASFTSQPLIRPCRKDVLSAENVSNVIYLFTCECGHKYVGRTSQRLGDRIKQHVPRGLVRRAQIEQPGENRSVASRAQSRTSIADQQLPRPAGPSPALEVVSPDISRLPQTAWEQLQKV